MEGELNSSHRQGELVMVGVTDENGMNDRAREDAGLEIRRGLE